MEVDSGIPHKAEIINISKYVAMRQGVFSDLQLHFYVSQYTIVPLENTIFPFKLSSNGLLSSYSELKPLVEFTMLVSLDVVRSDMGGQRVVVNTAAKFFIRIRGLYSHTHTRTHAHMPECTYARTHAHTHTHTHAYTNMLI